MNRTMTFPFALVLLAGCGSYVSSEYSTDLHPPTPQKEINATLTLIAENVRHGDADNLLSLPEQKDLLGSRPLSLTCSYITRLAVFMLKDQGVEARMVATETLQEKNGYDDGHNLLEVYEDDWVLYDLDNNVQPLHHGVSVSIEEFVRIVQAQEPYELRALATDAAFDPHWSYANEFEGFDLRSWYVRVLGTVIQKGETP